MFAKKSLGQNFLRSKGALMKIVETADLKLDDIVLEVGPGEGILTEAILRKAGKVIAVEKDNRLIPILEQKFSSEISSGKLLLVHGDILEFSLSSYQLPATHSTSSGQASYKLIANIPYYITGQLLRKFLESDNQPSRMVLLLQKEVAKRIVSGNNPALLKLRRTSPTSPIKNLGLRGTKESILSISVKAYGAPKYIDTVKAECFTPKPKVDSAILLVENI
jgi:16S rRNA (adenine1518-N6/adenine1519-N6)-dimethyltransferase